MSSDAIRRFLGNPSPAPTRPAQPAPVREAQPAAPAPAPAVDLASLVQPGQPVDPFAIIEATLGKEAADRARAATQAFAAPTVNESAPVAPVSGATLMNAAMPPPARATDASVVMAKARRYMPERLGANPVDGLGLA